MNIGVSAFTLANHSYAELRDTIECRKTKSELQVIEYEHD